MNIYEKIKKQYIRLSKGQRKVAQFILDSPGVVATHTASEVGRQIGVSESTVIRFCYAVDLSGFSELQGKLKEHFSAANEVVTIKKPTTLYSEVMSTHAKNILNTVQWVNDSRFNEVVEYIHSKQNLFIAGFQKATTSARWLYDHLLMHRQNVLFVTEDSKCIEYSLGKMQEGDILFVLIINELQEDIRTVMEVAKRKKLKVVVVTDYKAPLLIKNSDAIFMIQSSSPKNVTCSIALLSFLHALIECLPPADFNEHTPISG